MIMLMMKLEHCTESHDGIDYVKGKYNYVRREPKGCTKIQKGYLQIKDSSSKKK